MPTLTTPKVLKGPCVFERGGYVFRSRVEAKTVTTEETNPITSDTYGEVDTVTVSRHGVISITPEMFTAGLIALAWPYASTMPGTSLCGSVDVPLIIHALAEGKKYTFHRTAIIKMPDLDMSVGNGLIGEMQIGAVPKSGADLSDENSLVVIEDDPDFVDTSYDPSKVIVGPYNFAWAAGQLLTEAGIKASFETGITLEKTDGIGAHDWTLTSVGVTGSCIPTNLTIEELLAMQKVQGAGNGIGSRGSARGVSFTAACTGFAFALAKAVGTSGSETRFGANVRRSGTFSFKAHRTFTAGVRAALWTLGVGA